MESKKVDAGPRRIDTDKAMPKLPSRSERQKDDSVGNSLNIAAADIPQVVESGEQGFGVKSPAKKVDISA